MPASVPGQQWLENVVQGVNTEVQHWQATIAREQRHMAQQRFASDWKHGGALHASCVKHLSPPSVDSLLRDSRVSVKPLRVGKGKPAAFRVDDPSHVQPGVSWAFGKMYAVVNRVEGDVVYLDRPMCTQMFKKSVVQQTPCTDPNFLYQQFRNYWDGFWNINKAVDWDEVAKIAESMPIIQPFDPTVWPEDVTRAIKKLKAHKARGLDGWSNSELKSLSPHQVSMLADLFNTVLATGQWPSHLSSAFVSLLAKVPQPKGPKDARPITVLPSLYRLFGKIMTEKIFANWEGVLPDTLFGSVPGKCSMDAAWELASAIEESLAGGEDVFGVSLDLSKAYNTLNRDVVSFLAARAGWPESLIRAFRGYMDTFDRYFKIHGGFYGPVKSKVGVAEGCPLAVPAMILVTWAVTNFVAEPHASMVSYVDNWSLQAKTFRGISDALGKVTHATEILHLILNPDKSRAYATTAKSRKSLKSLLCQGRPLNVVLKVDDLGVDFNAGRQNTAASVLSRLDDSLPKLLRLRVMPWSAHRKSEVLLRTVHPAVSFGCELASVSWTTFNTLRRKYSSSVWGKHNQRNHFMSPLLAGSVVFEPFLLILQRRIAALQRAFAKTPDLVRSRWNRVLGSALSTSGPFAYLIDQLRLLGWNPMPNLHVARGTCPVISLVEFPNEHLDKAILQAWWSKVHSKICSQAGFDGLEGVNINQTLLLRTKSGCSPSLVGCVTSGATLFTAQKKHFVADDDVGCPFCGAVDSQMHRIRECPHFSSLRQSLPSWFFDTVPAAALQRGLWEIPPAVSTLYSALSALPNPAFQSRFNEKVCLFTDGSTFDPTGTPRSTWAVVLAMEGSFQSTRVEAGVLAGPQTNPRAELTAVLVAVQTAVAADIYSDSLNTVRGFRRLLREGWHYEYWRKQADVDLWLLLWRQLSAKPGPWSIHHVRSHQNPNEAKNPHEFWTFVHNQAADDAARNAHTLRDPLLVQAFVDAARASSQQLHLAKLVFELHEGLVKLGSSKPPEAGNPHPSQNLRPQRVFSCLPAVYFNRGLQHIECCLLNPPFMWVVEYFFCSQEWFPCDEGISFVELYLAFTKLTGWLAPVNTAKLAPVDLPQYLRSTVPSSWVHETQYAALKLCRPALSKQVTVFMHAVKDFFKRTGAPCEIVKTKSLDFVGVPHKLPSLKLRPEGLEPDGTEVSQIFAVDRYDLAVKRPYLPVSEPIASPVQFVDPRVTWSRYCSRHRQRGQ